MSKTGMFFFSARRKSHLFYPSKFRKSGILDVFLFLDLFDRKIAWLDRDTPGVVWIESP